ncbi:concanavalin A-like lectin/glucanase domain-containing protein, partial [Phaeosphaeriaceae sp. PMI808]
MRPYASLITVLATILPHLPIAGAHNDTNHGHYTLTNDLSYNNFFSAFDFFHAPDPTNGFVQYQNATSAIAQNLVGYLPSTRSVSLGVDYTTKDPNGRASTRLESKATWNQGLLIADIMHMPSSECGVWPAFWLLGTGPDGKAPWPNAGEIDILEGVNDYEDNSVTLHTSKGCTISNQTTSSSSSSSSTLPFSGTMRTSDCDVAAAHQDRNAGCSIHAPESLRGEKLGSYGTLFNQGGGGVYAMEWTSTFISVWFVPRDSDLYATYFSANGTWSSSSSSPDPALWGTPIARFSGNGCDFAQRFSHLRVIFNTGFCGEWAGREWEKGGCRAKTGVETCEEYVRENPEVFEEAYWEIGGLRWYRRG